MDQICRLCLRNGPDLGPIKDEAVPESTEPQDLVQLIFRYLSIQVVKFETSASSFICGDCRTSVEAWHSFYESCIRNDEIYQRKQSTSIEVENGQEADAEQNALHLKTEKLGKHSDNEDDENFVLLPTDAVMSSNASSSDDEILADVVEKQTSANKKIPLKKRGRPRKSETEKKKRKSRAGMAKKDRSEEDKRLKRAEVCTICGKFIKNISEHMRIHNNEKRHQCPYCPKAFVSASNYNSHVNIHTRAKMYKCDLCEKQYVLLNSLKQHRITHFKERVHLCPVCGKAYYQPTGLARHKRTHFEEPKIKCSECDKMFLSNADLRKHFSKHLDQKPFTCEICNRGFSRKDNLKTHMKTHKAAIQLVAHVATE